MSAFPILFELDELSEVNALHAAINAAAKMMGGAKSADKKA